MPPLTPRRFARAWLLIPLAVALAGGYLFVGFWPLVSTNAASLNAAMQFPDQPVRRPILLHDRVLDVSFNGYITYVLVGNAADPASQASIHVNGDARGVVAVGAGIYASVRVGASSWTADPSAPGGGIVRYYLTASVSDLHPAWPVDATFGAMAVGGYVILLIGFFWRRAPR